MIPGLLAVIPCGGRKVWTVRPGAGPTPARDAYIGSYFTVNRRFAEHFGERWIILSAKYGFIAPEFVIPGPYEVSFKRRKSGPISTEQLLDQARNMALGHFESVLVLGGADYLGKVREVFSALGINVSCPFEGLRMGASMSAANQAVKENRFTPVQYDRQEDTPCR